MNKSIKLLLLSLLFTACEASASPPIVLDFGMSIRAEVDSAHPGNYISTEMRLDYVNVRDGYPVIGNRDDPDAQCVPPPDSPAPMLYVGATLNGGQIQGFHYSCWHKPDGTDKTQYSNQELLNTAVSRIWGGYGVWKNIPRFYKRSFPIGEPVIICFIMGQSEDICNTGEAPSKPVYPVNPDVTCSLPGSVTLQHGTLNSKDVNGNVSSKSVIITCTGSTTANLKVGATAGSDDGKISLGSGINSVIKVNSTPGHASVNLNSGSNSVSLSSNLSNSGTAKSGEYKGSGVMTLSID